MNIKEFEIIFSKEIEKIIENIIKDNKELPISAKSRAWAEISDFLENKFVEYTKDHHFLINSKWAPKEKTKNPRDAKTYVKIWENDLEEIRIDFKAFKISKKDTNPDIWTPDKIIKFINQKNFYLVYIHVYYDEYGNWLKFVENNKKLVKSYLLKDIDKSFRRTPTNQLQINWMKEPTYRTRAEFIKLLVQKLKESYDRELEKIKKKKKELDLNTLLKNNKESEDILKKKLKNIEKI